MTNRLSSRHDLHGCVDPGDTHRSGSVKPLDDLIDDFVTGHATHEEALAVADALANEDSNAKDQYRATRLLQDAARSDHSKRGPPPGL